jgi:parvulin-like peptidyl-prolyl isomerase
MSDSLTTDQEAEAKELEARIRHAVDHEIVALARLLVSKSDRELFGHTEFQVRDVLLRAGAKAYEEYLREKKTATKVRPSIAPTANKKLSSRIICR